MSNQNVDAMKEVSNSIFEIVDAVFATTSPHIAVAVALGGVSLGLARAACELGLDRETLKSRVAGDIDAIYDAEEAIRKAEMQ